MDPLKPGDVPYGNDWDSTDETGAYAESSDRARPWRTDIRTRIASEVLAKAPRGHVLELGPGPGLLAHAVLSACPDLTTYTLLDFSEPMLALCRERLAALPTAATRAAARYVRGSFKSDDWPGLVRASLGGATPKTGVADRPLDCVVTMQAVHELRHKRHAVRLYEQVRGLLAPGGLFLVCDHLPFDDTTRSQTLYMTQDEQQQALTQAGFTDVRVLLEIKGLVLYAGTAP